MTFDDWCANHGVYLNDNDDAARAARLMARHAWDAAVAESAKLCEPKIMRLWVLEGVLTDYTDGMVCVLARDEVEAWAMLEKKDATAWAALRGWPEEPDTRPLDELPTRFRCVDTPEAFTCWGGG